MSNVIRVVKNCNYTTLSNYHFRDKRLSWKAKGLLSTMLSLPDDWNYTIEGLASLSDDGIKATNSGLAELEKCGYLTRKQLRDDNGHFIAMEYIIYEKAVEEKEDPVQEITEPKREDEPPLCQNGQTAENTAFLPSCQKRQTGKRQTEKGVLLNTNILNTKESNTYSSSSSTVSVENQNEDQNKSRRQYLLDEEEEQRLRERLRVDAIAATCSVSLTEAVFRELCRRDEDDFRQLMTAQALEQVCLAIKDKQRREPIRMLPNLINTYLDNIMHGIRAAGGGTSPPYQAAQGNPFNRFEQNQYDFDALEKELLKN
ncbi:MAG: helix-turn-helix domain-containing protein [Lachnospiraceae bacterium]|nr:helix-turn-helix domain-containing protein [Lachnospiraceae bacterium]